MKVFFPSKFVLVPASTPPHPPDTQYKVSIGDEDWSGKLQTVLKIQMVYKGKVSGRRSPSYPIDSDDYIRVHEAVTKLLNDI